jgi:hypothetical protein
VGVIVETGRAPLEARAGGWYAIVAVGIAVKSVLGGLHLDYRRAA